MCLSLLHFQPCAGSDPDCNCCLSNKYTYMQLRSPEVTRVNFHLTVFMSRCAKQSLPDFIKMYFSVFVTNDTEDAPTAYTIYVSL